MRLVATTLLASLLATLTTACSVASPEPAPAPVVEARPATPQPTTDTRPATPTLLPATPPPRNLATEAQCEAAAKNFWRLSSKQAMDGLGPDATVETQAQLFGVLEERGHEFVENWKSSCLGTMTAPMVDCFATVDSFAASSDCARLR